MPTTDTLDLTDEQRARLAQAVQDAQSAYPDPAAVPEESYQQTGLQRVFEGFAGMEDQRQQAPRGFLEGIVGGVQRGLGSAGSRIAAERQKFEEQVARRRANQDALRIEAGRNRSQAVATELSGIRKDTRSAAADTAKDARTATADQVKYDRDNPKPGTIEYRANLQKLTDEERARSAGKPPPAPPSDNALTAVHNPDGSVSYLPHSVVRGRTFAGPTGAGKPSTGEQKQALAFYNRAKGAIDEVYDPSKPGESLEDRIAAVANKNPTGAAIGESTWNVFKGADRQRYEQSVSDFARALLRKESGAAISPKEFADVERDYFVKVGDTPEKVAQKRRARDRVLDGLKFGAGPAYKEFYGEDAAPVASTGAITAAPPPSTVPKPGGFFATNKPKVAR